MTINNAVLKQIKENLTSTLRITDAEWDFLELQTRTAKAELTLEAYITANNLNGTGFFDAYLPVLVVDEDYDIEEVLLPEDIDWSEPKFATLKEEAANNGIYLRETKPTPGFQSFLNIASIGGIQNHFIKAIEFARDNKGSRPELQIYEPDLLVSKDGPYAIPNIASLSCLLVENQLNNRDLKVINNNVLDVPHTVERQQKPELNMDGFDR